jgi:hypothetical protein
MSSVEVLDSVRARVAPVVIVAWVLLGCTGQPAGPTSTPDVVAAGDAAVGRGDDAAVGRGDDAAVGPREDASPPQVVGACDNLGAVGEWQRISPPGIRAVLHVLVDPVNSGTIYAGGWGVYRSTNCGADWTMVSTGRNGALINGGGQWTMALDPVDTNVMYAGSLYGPDYRSLFKSTNGGRDWDSLFPTGSEVARTVDFFQEVSMDPNDRRHLVVSFHNNCTGAFGPMCMAESTDAGATWRLFRGPTPAWEEDARPLVLNATSWLYAAGWADGLFYTGDRGATWERVGRGAGHQVYRASTGVYYLGNAEGMFRSTDGRVWTSIRGTPPGNAVSGDGQRIFTGVRNLGDSRQPYYTADESDDGVWRPLPSPPMSDGAVTLRYDSGHHVLYSANADGGLWRMVTR